MRVSALLLAVAPLLATSAGAANGSFPYTAEISVDSAAVRCGPGRRFYATMRLPKGATVEVYRHDAEEWLAIRPPEGSFSWIPARQVERTATPQVGRVLLEGTVAWVGSSVTKVQQHKWQVRLERSERLRILGEESISMGPGFATETHYKVAPPAGEFRWIAAEQTTESGSRPATSRTSNQSGQVAATRTDRRNNLRTRSRHSAEPNQSQAAQPADSSPSQLSSQERNQLRKQIDQLKLDLSIVVSDQIDQWNLAPLKRRADTLMDAAQATPLSRQLRLIAHRIREFERVKEGHEQVRRSDALETEKERRIKRHGVRAAPRRRRERVTQTSWQEEIEASLETNQIIGTGVKRSKPTPVPSFDAQGWLMPVHGTRRPAPPYAVLDERGRVICYAQPSPGLNLRRYAKKHVGLFGDTRPMPRIDASLLTVTRVVKRER